MFLYRDSFVIETYVVMLKKSHFFQRFKEHVAMLSNEVQLIQKSREEVVSNSEKRFHKEKVSLQSDYEKATLK